MKKTTLILALLMPLLLLFQFCQKDDENVSDISIEGFSNSVNDVNVTLVNFIEKAHAFETTDVTTMPIEDVTPFIDAYIQSAQDYLDALNREIEIQQSAKKIGFKSTTGGFDCHPVDFLPGPDNGPGLGLVKAVRDLISETKGDRDVIQQKWLDEEIDDNVYLAAINELKIKKPAKVFNVGLGAVLGTGAAAATGLIVGTATLPAIATIAVVGGVVGTATTWFANWYSGVNKDGDPQYYMMTGQTSVGESIPLSMFGDNATLVIAVDGYAPVAINEFDLPDPGINKTIEIKGIKLEDAEWGGSTEVCYFEEELAATSCSEVQFVTATPYPMDPGPGQGVTVTASLVPFVEACDISFSIVGTDGYSNSATTPSDALGQASFYIPGGEEGIVDIVTITSSNGKTYTVTYVF